MRQGNNTRLMLLVASVLALAVLLPNTSTHTAFAIGQTSTGVMIPLYGYPSSDWNSVIAAKLANPTVPIVAIINPAGGPGWYEDPTFVYGIRSLQGAGITVLGYVYTSYAARSVSSAESDISGYLAWYHVDGIYLDQMSNVPGQESYYSTLTSFSKLQGMSLVVGNPGADVPPSYIGTVDTIVIYESPGLPSLSSLAGWHTDYAKSNFAIVAYGVNWVDLEYLASSAKYLQYISLTDGVWPNPYAPISSYFGWFVAKMGSVTSIASTPPTSTLTISTVDQNGNAIAGYYTTLWQNGVQLQSCFSPCSFTVNPEQTYSVAVADFGFSSFNHWSDSSLNRFATLTVTNGGTIMALTAVYS